jgi:hypothetical protein
MFCAGSPCHTGYSWDWDVEIMKLAQTPPLPQLVVTNHALAHRQHDLKAFQDAFQRTEYTYWKKEHHRNNAPLPRYAFYQNGKALHGRKGAHWSAEKIRRLSAYLRSQFVDDLGFMELDEFIITAGRVDNFGTRNDG